MKPRADSIEVREETKIGGLRVLAVTLRYATRFRTELLNITTELQDAIRKSGIRAGLATIQSLHTTAGVFINEFQDALLADMKEFLEKAVAGDAYYRHNDPELSDCGRKNADAHLRALLLSHCVSLPIREGKLALGRWQSIILAELDGPQPREVQLQILGVA
jgi:secondary thiamine-phosphate synthase enzyme